MIKITKDNIADIYRKYHVSKDRACHSLGVAELAVKLALVYNINPEKAWVAGALHDLARDWSNGERTEYVSKHKLATTDDETQDNILSHAKIAAHICKQELDINDLEILSAIASHTTGRAEMSPIEEIVFIADFVESTAEQDEFRVIRAQMLVSRGHTINLINGEMTKYIESLGKPLSKDFLKTRDYYSKY